MILLYLEYGGGGGRGGHVSLVRHWHGETFPVIIHTTIVKIFSQTYNCCCVPFRFFVLSRNIIIVFVSCVLRG